jgi:hypothetical protein
VTLTLTCSGAGGSASGSGSITINGSQPPPPPPNGCPATITGPDGATRTLLSTGTITYGINTVARSNVDLSQWNNIWGYNSPTGTTPAPWSSASTQPVIRNFPRAGYVGAQFKTSGSGTFNGIFTNPTASNRAGGPALTMAISTVCGDFSASLPTPGCLASKIPTNDMTMVAYYAANIGKSPTYFCMLQPNTTYYVNILQSNINDTNNCSLSSTTCPLAPWLNPGP